MDVGRLGQTAVLQNTVADVGLERERLRLAKVRRVAMVLAPVTALVWFRLLSGQSPLPRPSIPISPEYMPAAFLGLVLILSVCAPLIAAGRSPHVLYRPSEIDVSLDDVRGAGVVRDEVVKTLNLFLAHKTFRDRMGGTPRKAILFEGPPGTGKTYMAKAMAHEAGVPFLFVSSSAFQSMYYGQTNRKIRSYFKALRKAARREGGAIGFIEEIDAIGGSRRGMGGNGPTDGVSGVVNELLIQLQSFDQPTLSHRIGGFFIDHANRWLPTRRQRTKAAPAPANVLIIGATNRKDDLDPALLRPGRFDRSIYFDLPSRSGRVEIIDYYLGRKAHDPELDDPAVRDRLAAMTFGYSPVMIEHMLDEALVWALRRGAGRLSWDDIQQARFTEELGLKQPVEYTEAECRMIATHEAGHATVAWLVGKGRKLEVLSIIKRGSALGLLAHSETEERFTTTQSEIEALIRIAFGGMVAEEIFFGESGTGPSGDLLYATGAAAQMVGSLGMGGSLISLDASSGQPGANIVTKVLSFDHGREAVERILLEAKEEVTRMLSSNRDIVEALRDALLESDELVGDAILDVIQRTQLGVIADLRTG
jgi:ATP-dependent Zn protease